MDDQKLGELVRRFYARVRQDAGLSPIFEDAIENWGRHLDLLTDFWSSIMLTSGRYKGNPMAAHLKHAPRLTPALFDRWLSLWEQTALEVLEPDEAALILSKARRIATSLQLAIHHHAAA